MDRDKYQLLAVIAVFAVIATLVVIYL